MAQAIGPARAALAFGMGPIELLHPDPPSRFGGAPGRNAYVELHNLVAAAEHARDFGPSDRVRISRQHGVDLARAFLAERVALYQAVLDDRLADADLDGEDRETLAHLADTLALRPADLRATHERAFGTVVSEAVADDYLSVSERLLIYKLQHLLGLDPLLADGAYDVIARERLLVTVAHALADGELGSDEEAQIALAESSLSVELPPDVRAMLDQARRRWQARRGTVPTARVDVRLNAKEVGRYQAPARWSFVDVSRLERRFGDQVLHSGRTAGLLVPDHVLSGRPRTGSAALTSQRLVLQPDSGLPDEYRLGSVLQTLRFRNGIVVRMQNGRRLYLDLGRDLDAFYAVLYRVVEAGAAAAPD